MKVGLREAPTAIMRRIILVKKIHWRAFKMKGCFRDLDIGIITGYIEVKKT